MTDEIDWERLARYVSGEATAAERSEIERWTAGNPDRSALVASLERRWRDARSPEAWDTDRAWTRVASRLRAPASRSADVVDITPFLRARQVERPFNPRRLIPLAAAAVLVAAVYGGWQAWQPGSTSSGTASATLDVRTAPGERRELSLPDGSHVVVGPSSVVRVGREFGGKAREVYLQGEALFTVRHDEARPFRVFAAGAVTEDLGTAFSVRAYPAEREVRVAVSEGSVSLRRAGTEASAAVVLHARDVGRLTSQGEPVVVRDQPVDQLLAWAAGELVFEDTPLAEVARELERWYDLEIRLADPQLGRRLLTATFHGESADEVLRVVAVSLELTVERRGRIVTLRSAEQTTFQPVNPAGPRRVEAGF